MLKKLSSSAFEFISVAVGAVVAVAIIFCFGFRLTTVVGRSMQPTLQEGDKLLTTAMHAEYEYKDIVIVVEPNEQLYEPIIKRVIATEGQWIEVNYEDGLVYVGDTRETMKPLDESYTASLTDRVLSDDNHDYPVQVPEGHYFCMGDNRNHSIDSRSSAVSFVDENYILGKAVVRLVPFGDYNIYD